MVREGYLICLMINGKQGGSGGSLTRLNWQGRFNELSFVGILRLKCRKRGLKDLLVSGTGSTEGSGLKTAVKRGSTGNFHSETLWEMPHLFHRVV